jgi:rRNA maturation endonuclease Nob1
MINEKMSFDRITQSISWIYQCTLCGYEVQKEKPVAALPHNCH